MTGADMATIPSSGILLISLMPRGHPVRLADKIGVGYTSFQLYIHGIEPMQVSRWGNSLAIRLPAAVVEALGLREGDDVTLHAAGKRILEIEKTPGTKELLARLRRFRGRLPKDFKFDRLEANERR
jgi:antitoxin MazE